VINEARWEKYCELQAAALDLSIAAALLEIEALDYDDLGSESSRLDLQEAKRNSVASMRRTAAKYRGSLEDDAENA